jgi:hypothetical protein
MLVVNRFSRAWLPAVKLSMRARKVLPLYAADIDDDTIRILLNELASEIGRILEQEEVHVAYRDRTWTLKAVGRTTG